MKKTVTEKTLIGLSGALLSIAVATPSFAQEGGPTGGANPWLSQLFLFGSFGLIFYFLILRPQQKRQRELRNMLDSLKSGDKVVTTGGMIGTIQDLRNDTVILKIANDVKAEFTKASITGKAETAKAD